MGLRLTAPSNFASGEARRPRRPALHAVMLSSSYITATEGLIIRRKGTGEALFAARAFAAGEPVFAFTHLTWRATRDAFTTEDPNGRHLHYPLLARVAHSCDPNCRPSFELMALIARRDIAPGEPISVDFLSTEGAINEPFDCRCGAATCRGRIERADPSQPR
jgi:hypothetical protein